MTGAGGFIGGHLSVALAREGADVRALCRYNSRGERGTLAWFGDADADAVEVVFGDLRDAESVAAAAEGVDAVFHLGAQIAIPYSYVNPRDFFETNVLGSLNVALAALGAGASLVVHVSTSEVYGNAQELPITERHPLAPGSPYAASKVGADALMEGLRRSHGLPVVTVRPFNTYGPHQSARAIVPTIVAQALRGSGPVRLGSLDPRRDLTFVSDTVAGLIACARPELEGRTLQLGSGSDIAVGELVALIGELVGRELEVETEERRVRPPASEVMALRCDHSAASAATGWEPRVSLRQGLQRTVEWLERNISRYAPGEYAT